MNTPVKDSTEVIIIGGGPAGLSAAAWCAELGMKAILIEKGDELGGQLHSIHNPIGNYLGLAAKDGREMLAHFLRSVERSEFVRLLRTEVFKVDAGSMSVATAAGEIFAKAIVIASGVRRRSLGIRGEREFRGKGILESGARDRELVKGQGVLIVGGGDAAFENALLLSEYAGCIKIAFRKPRPTARDEFQSAVAACANVELLSKCVVNEIIGTTTLSSVKLENTGTGENWIEPIDSILIRIGVEPNSEFVRGVVELDSQGFIKVNGTCETDQPRIYAVGDVGHPNSPTISTAAGTGASAAKIISAFLRQAYRI